MKRFGNTKKNTFEHIFYWVSSYSDVKFEFSIVFALILVTIMCWIFLYNIVSTNTTTLFFHDKWNWLLSKHNHEPRRGKRLGEVSIQRTTFGAISAYAIPFDKMQDQLQGTTAWYMPVQCHSSGAARNIERTFQKLRCILSCQPWTFWTRPNVIPPCLFSHKSYECTSPRKRNRSRLYRI